MGYNLQRFITTLIQQTLALIGIMPMNQMKIYYNSKIRCLKTVCIELCNLQCPCTGYLCKILSKSNLWGIPEQKSFCYGHCCAAGLRNIIDIHEIVDILHGKVRLVMKYTDIQIIKDDSLKNNWSEIYLTHSNISTIEPNAFKNFTKLEKLHLSNNLISYIHHGTFSGSDNLFQICMHNNRLTAVYSFSGLKSLSSLILFSNKVHFVQHFKSVQMRT